LLARLVGEKLTGPWGQQVVVDQRPGGGGTIAQDIVAKSAADGYTWLFSTAAFTINATLMPHQQTSLTRDFAPVMLWATATFYLLVNSSVPAHSVSELIELACAKPGQLNYSSAGVGTPPHLAGEMFRSMAHINIVHVPYKTAAAAVTDLIGGQVQMSFQFAPTALPHIKSGKLRALAVSTAKRSPAAPELPTIAESGLPGFEVLGWDGVHVPKGTPKAIIDRIDRDALEALKLSDVRERMATAGLDTPEEFTVFVRNDIARWAKVIAEAGIKPE
jgi:tripartite-type tricarboxylate transporter receptor subunit TctC